MLQLLITALRSARDARKRGRTATIGAFWLVLVVACDARLEAFDLSEGETAALVAWCIVATEYAWAKARTRLGIAP
jgi:hypothetical protein